jgi:membrane protease subunit (stomatin/prohibitin family)
MGLGSFLGSQMVDVIEYVDPSDKIVVHKYERPGNEIKEGARVIVRESQCGIFLKGGELKIVLSPGTHRLTTENIPVLSSLKAIGHGFNSPIKADLYFVSLKQFIDNKWGTKNPIILRDKEFKLVRVRAFGAFVFRIIDPTLFMREVFGTQGKVMTYDIVDYLTSLVVEAVTVAIAKSGIAVIDLATSYRELSLDAQERINQTTRALGVDFTRVVVENISLPEEVAKLIDEQSGIGMASGSMDTFVQYQSARALRDAAQQDGGLAGLGASFAIGQTLATTFSPEGRGSKAIEVRCPQCDAPNDENAKFCGECGMKLRKEIECPKCGVKLGPEVKFCPECGGKL